MFEKQRSGDWPSVSGKIVKGQVRRGLPARYQFFVWRSLLRYSYNVDGSEFSGDLVLTASSEEAALDLQTQCDGKIVTVHYNPRHPGKSFLAETQLATKQVMQNPWWLR
jgi:hypothetical protein